MLRVPVVSKIFAISNFEFITLVTRRPKDRQIDGTQKPPKYKIEMKSIQKYLHFLLMGK